MNIPFTKSQVRAFKDSNVPFLSSGSIPNRAKRRNSRKDRKKNRFVIFKDPKTGHQYRSIETLQYILLSDGTRKRIHHFTD